MKNNNTDIIIVKYKDDGVLNKCIESIQKHCTNYELIIIDNDIENLGYTKAINKGIKNGNSEFIWLLNQDAIVLENAQKSLIKRFSYHEKVGIVGSMQLDPDEPDIIRHGGTLQAFPNGVHKGGRLSMFHCIFPEKQKWVNFASVMLRRKMVNEIGLLDESMFLLYSDSDYCYYARMKGWEVWYEPDSRVLHRLNSSKNPPLEIYMKDFNSFINKWGIIYDKENKRFILSDLFDKLNTFP